MSILVSERGSPQLYLLLWTPVWECEATTGKFPWKTIWFFLKDIKEETSTVAEWEGRFQDHFSLFQLSQNFYFNAISLLEEYSWDQHYWENHRTGLSGEGCWTPMLAQHFSAILKIGHSGADTYFQSWLKWDKGARSSSPTWTSKLM